MENNKLKKRPSNALYRFLSRRGSGFTTLSIEGAKNYDRPFLFVGINSVSAKEYVKRTANANCSPASIDDLSIESFDGPGVIDHYCVFKTLDGYESYINMLESNERDLRKELNEIRELLGGNPMESTLDQVTRLKNEKAIISDICLKKKEENDKLVGALKEIIPVAKYLRTRLVMKKFVPAEYESLIKKSEKLIE